MNTIRKITLKETEIVEVDGKFEHKTIEEKTLPMILNNRSLLFGKRKGYFDGTTTDIINTDLNDMPKVYQLLYMAVEGGNKGFANEHSLEDFTDLINHYRVDEIVFMGLQVTQSHIPDTYDEFEVVLEEWLRQEEMFSKLESDEKEVTSKDLRKKK